MSKYSKEDIQAVKKNDPAAPSSFTIYWHYPGVIALRRHRRANFWYRHGFKKLAFYISYRTRKITGIEIHPAAKLGRRIFIDHGMGVVIGETSIIGDDVIIYQGVTLGTTIKEKVDRHPIIGNRVILYAYATIIGRITIGDDSIIGAHAIVNQSIEPFSMVKAEKASIHQRHK